MFHIPSFREAMFRDPYLSPCPWDHFAASCRISLKTRTSGCTQNLFFFRTSDRIPTGNREDAPWCRVGYFKFYLACTKRLFITTTRSVISCWIVAFVWRVYERLGIPMPTAHPGICTQECPLPKNVMSNSGIFPKSTGIPRTHDWQ